MVLAGMSVMLKDVNIFKGSLSLTQQTKTVWLSKTDWLTTYFQCKKFKLSSGENPKYSQVFWENIPDTIYTTLEDFTRIDNNLS